MNDNKSKQSNQKIAEVETLGPVSLPKKSLFQKKIIFGSFLIVSVMIGFGFLGYSFKKEKNYSADLNGQLETLSTQVVRLKTETKTLNQEVAPSKTIEPTITAKPSKLVAPVVVFAPNGQFTQKDQQEINKMLINPMVDYTPEAFVAIQVEKYQMDKPTNEQNAYKYKVITIGEPEKGGSGGFVYGEDGKPLGLWVPECLNICKFSDDYKQKHPEVVKKYQEVNPSQ